MESNMKSDIYSVDVPHPLSTLVGLLLMKQLQWYKFVINLCFNLKIIFYFQQRVIFYLVAIPLSLQSQVLEKDIVNRSERITCQVNYKTDSPNTNQKKLIPLLMGTLPRLDCLKMIYSHIIKHREIHLKIMKERNKS